MTLDELDRLHAAATAGEWVVSHDRNAQPNLYSRDADGFEHWLAILPHQCLVSLEVLANANAASIVAMHNAWPAISARIRAADVDAANLRVMLDRALGENVGLRAECERLRAALRSVLAEHDGMHDDDCDVRGMSTGDDGVSHNAWGEERRCTCGSTGSRNAARAALGEP